MFSANCAQAGNGNDLDWLLGVVTILASPGMVSEPSGIGQNHHSAHQSKVTNPIARVWRKTFHNLNLMLNDLLMNCCNLRLIGAAAIQLGFESVLASSVFAAFFSADSRGAQP
jgi:hypothetical protein